MAKRIAKDIEIINETPIEHCYLDYTGDCPRTIQVLFIGPRDSPYSRMFLRFRIDLPQGYPIKPPKVLFLSDFGRKIHPNVFPGGWVCLSTLNESGSDSWAPTLSLASVLKTLYSMFTKEMIMIDNTHGHERSEEFFPAVMNDVFYTNVRLMETERNEKFRGIMEKYVKSHRGWYLRKLERLANQHDGELLMNYYQNVKGAFGNYISAYTTFGFK